MFKQNKYTNIYYKIINKAKTLARVKSKENYYESHHIIPRSLGGDNSTDNKVLLTFKEHYICHRLLPKMVLNQEQKIKMNYALYVLSKASEGQYRLLTKHQRMICLEANRKASSNRTHKPNLGNRHSEETKQILREKSSGRTHSDKVKQIIKENNKKTNVSRGNKVRAALTGKTKSEEHKRKIAESIKRRHRERKLVACEGIEPT